jgi:hypothetical protein
MGLGVGFRVIRIKEEEVRVDGGKKKRKREIGRRFSQT